MKNILITGGAGFFGDLLKRNLVQEGFRCVSVDVEADDFQHPESKAVRGDIRNFSLLDELCRETRFDAVFHCAAILAHAI
ncbi:MAG: NAD-dependent epimerase/dehydratase family protein, partial [Pseudohongiellaceae bacterium]